MLQKKNTNQNLKVFTKQEPKPSCINSDLQQYYDNTDLSMQYVFDACKTLKPLKGIDVNAQQVEFWYVEFIKMGWTKKTFDEQFEAIKRAMLYNRIDFENWVSTERLYNKYDLNRNLDKRINNLIQKGNFLKGKTVELSEEEKTAIDLAEAKETVFKYESEYYTKRDEWRTERLNYWDAILSNKDNLEAIKKMFVIEKEKQINNYHTEGLIWTQ